MATWLAGGGRVGRGFMVLMEARSALRPLAPRGCPEGPAETREGRSVTRFFVEVVEEEMFRGFVGRKLRNSNFLHYFYGLL